MKFKPAVSAEIFFTLAIVIILVAYTLVGSVDIIFREDSREVYRIEDATVFSDLALPEGEDDVFTYTDMLGDHTFSDSPEFRFEIAKTVLVNLFTFKWDESDHVIILYKQ